MARIRVTRNASAATPNPVPGMFRASNTIDPHFPMIEIIAASAIHNCNKRLKQPGPDIPAGMRPQSRFITRVRSESSTQVDEAVKTTRECIAAVDEFVVFPKAGGGSDWCAYKKSPGVPGR